jgi:Flp pilus assembly protein TadG
VNGRAQASQSGQGLVEFALVLPIVVFLLIALFDLGRGVYAYNTVSSAAREGARVAAVNQIESSPECLNDRPIVDPADAHWSIKACAVRAAVSLGIPQGSVTVAYTAPPGTTLQCPGPSAALAVGCVASVTVTHRHEAITPVIANLVGPIDMSATSNMAIERVFP